MSPWPSTLLSALIHYVILFAQDLQYCESLTTATMDSATTTTTTTIKTTTTNEKEKTSSSQDDDFLPLNLITT